MWSWYEFLTKSTFLLKILKQLERCIALQYFCADFSHINPISASFFCYSTSTFSIISPARSETWITFFSTSQNLWHSHICIPFNHAHLWEQLSHTDSKLHEHRAHFCVLEAQNSFSSQQLASAPIGLIPHRHRICTPQKLSPPFCHPVTPYVTK